MKNRQYAGTTAMTVAIFLAAVWAGGAGAVEEVTGAGSLKPDMENGFRVFRVCAACHGTEGWGQRDGDTPVIAGQHKRVLIKQLADIRSGYRDIPAMAPFAAPKVLGGVQAIADVAGYIAVLPMTADNGTGPGTHLQRGGDLYQEHCIRCHGVKGAGNAKAFVPRIQGQHFAYLVRQFRWIRDGKRRNANRDMALQARQFSDQDVEAVMDYVSRLRPAAERLAPKGWRNPDFH